MSSILETVKRILTLGRRRTLARGLDEEIQFHLDQQIAKHRRAGLDADEARRQALVKFGGVAVTRERTLDEIRPALVEDTLRDLRHGLRVLWHAPGFTAAALVTLALGIGATSAIVGVVRTVLLEPLPYRDPDRLVSVWETTRGGAARNVIAPANFVAWQERARTIEHFGMVGPASIATRIDSQAARINGLTASSEVFGALGVSPAIGRAYTADEDARTDVIVLSHELWQRRLGGRADVLSVTLTTDAGPRTIIGVMPPGFTIAGQRADFLIPYGRTVAETRAARGRESSYALGRLRDGVSFDQAAAEMRRLFAALEQEAPDRNARRTVIVLPLHEQMVGDVRPALIALVGAVVLVLLVACVNVANLLLARSAARERELGMRAALGARRGRLVRQMLVESLVLAIGGGAAGVAVAALCQRGLLALVGDRIPVPRLDQLTLDLPVIAFTMLVALATGLLFGLVPAFVSTSRASEALRDGGRHGGGQRLHRVLRTLVVVEVALSLVLLAGAGLLMRSLLELQRVDVGFRAEHALAINVQLPSTHYDSPRGDALYREALSRIAALPDVQHAAGASCPPVPFSCIGTSFWRADRPRPADGQLASSQVRPITPGLFRAMGIPQVAGRDFSDADTADSMPVAIVSEELVRQQFGDDGSPLGRRLRVNVEHANGQSDVEWTVVGVVGNTRSTLDGPVRQTIYIPRPQRPSLFMEIVVRTAHDPLLVAPSVARIVRELEPDAPIEVRTMTDVVGASIARPRALSLLVGVFALVALMLAAVGVYGVMAYSVRARTQEIGVRMALGATAAAMFRLVIGQALRLVCAGVVIGLVAAAMLARLLTRLLYNVAPLDPLTFAGTAAVLLGVAALASYLPARRGMRMAPVEALRTN
jgi:putative ABC transport system permease protein